MLEFLHFLASQDAVSLVDAGTVLDVTTVASAGNDSAPPTATIFDLTKFLTYWNALLVVAVWTIIQSTRRALPEPLFVEGKPLARLLPMAAILGCNVAVWIPGPWLSPSETAGQRLILGTVLGALTANFHAVASKLGLHQFLGLEPKPKPKHKN